MSDELLSPEELAALNVLHSNKIWANNELISTLNTLTRTALNTYPDAEMMTWPMQAPEAARVLAAVAAGEDVTLDMAPHLVRVCMHHHGPADQALRIEQLIAKATAVSALSGQFMPAAAFVNGLRARTQDRINAATTPGEVNQILEAAKSEAYAALSTMG